MSRIVITGARGYIGISLAERLASEGYELRLVSRKWEDAPRLSFPDRVERIEADLRIESEWARVIADADAVIHLSSYTELLRAESDPEASYNANVLPVHSLVAAAARSDRKGLAVVFASTATIVGCQDRNPVDEFTPDNPITVYDRHKLFCERILADATERSVVRACSIRLSNVYGYGAPSSNANRGVLNVMLKRAANGEPMTMYGDGRYVRDFLHIEDVVQAFQCALESKYVQRGRHYVVASGVGRSLKEAFELVASNAKALIGRSVVIKCLPEPSNFHPIERRNFVGNSALFHADAGWTPYIDLEEGIRKYFVKALQRKSAPKSASTASFNDRDK